MAQLNVIRSERGLGQVLGMDVLGRYCCHFRLAAGVIDLKAPPGVQAGNKLVLDCRGHAYIDVHWPGTSARAYWDTGASATMVDRSFWLAHPELFEQIGASAGTDAHGGQAETPLLLMAGPVIGQRPFQVTKPSRWTCPL